MRLHHLIFSIMTGAAFAAFPVLTTAQEPTQAPSQQPGVYLDQAGNTLNSMPKPVAHDASKPLGDLRTHFDELNKAYRAEKDHIGPPLTRRDPNQNIPTWRDKFSDVERDLVVLIGGGSTLGPSAVPGSEVVAPNPSATEPGAPPSPIAGANLSPVGTTGATPSVAMPMPSSAGTTVGVAGSGGGATTTTPGTSTTTNPTGAPGAAPPVETSAPATTPAPVLAPSAPTAPGGVSAAPSGDTLAMADSLAATKVSVTGLKDLTPAVRAQLAQFRLQLELFYSATMGSFR